jgi:hypothetical protein
MEITTSQAKTRTETAPKPEHDVPRTDPGDQESAEDEELYMARTDDLVARVRRARDAAQREMESFGDVSEYEVTKIHGQKEGPETAPSAIRPGRSSEVEQPS